MTMMADGISIVEYTRNEIAEEKKVRTATERRVHFSQLCFRLMWLLVPLTVVAFYVLYKAMSPAGALGALTAGMLLAVTAGLNGVAATRRLETATD